LQVAVRTDGAGAEENEREGAEKFGDKFLEGRVHGGEILAEEAAARGEDLTQSARREEHRGHQEEKKRRQDAGVTGSRVNGQQ
jgi:polyhydroxyalkanoate synthesis regulator phasin